MPFSLVLLSLAPLSAQPPSRLGQASLDRLSSSHSTHSPRVQRSMPSRQHPWEEGWGLPGPPLSSDLSSGAGPHLSGISWMSPLHRGQGRAPHNPPLLFYQLSALPPHPPTHPPRHQIYPVTSRPLTAEHHKYLVSHVRVLQVYPWKSSWTCLILSNPCLSSGPHIPHLDYPITWHYSSWFQLELLTVRPPRQRIFPIHSCCVLDSDRRFPITIKSEKKTNRKKGR